MSFKERFVPCPIWGAGNPEVNQSVSGPRNTLSIVFTYSLGHATYKDFYQRHLLCPGQAGLETKAQAMASDLDLSLGAATQQLCESE